MGVPIIEPLKKKRWMKPPTVLDANGVPVTGNIPKLLVDEKGRPIITLIKTPSEIDPEAIAAQRKLFEKEFLEAGSRANFTAGMAYKKLGTLKPNEVGKAMEIIMDTTLFWTEGKGRFPAKEFKTVAEAQGWLGNLILREGNRGADSRIRQAKMAKGVLDEALAEARKPKKRIIIARG